MSAEEKGWVNADELSVDRLQKFAFLLHLRDYQSDMGLYWKPLSKIPKGAYHRLFKPMKRPSVEWSRIYVGEEKHLLGINETLLLSAQDMLSLGRWEVVKRIHRVIDRLVGKGYSTVGLGALTSPMTKGGLLLANRQDISVTNGNAFTASAMFKGVFSILEKDPALMENHAIVGATGSVGSCLARLLVTHRYTDNLLLIARNDKRLQMLKNELNMLAPNIKIETSTDVSDIRKFKLVTLLTASATTIIQPEWLQDNAVILDGTQPRNTSPLLTEKRPDVTVIDGGIIHAPGITLKKGGMGLAKNSFYACFSETLLLALDGQKEHFCLGDPTLEQVQHIDHLAKKYQQYGFGLADFTSFGKPLLQSRFA